MLKMLKLGKKWRLHLTTVEEDEENARGKELLAITKTGKLLHVSEQKSRYAISQSVNSYEQLHFSDVAEQYVIKELNRALIEPLTTFQLSDKPEQFLVRHKVSQQLVPQTGEKRYTHEIEIFTAQNMLVALRRL